MRKIFFSPVVSPAKFKKILYSYFDREGRILPWRPSTDPYCIYVSEVMLQQTQAERVAMKYPEFIACFPNFLSLDSASFPEVLAVWQGLGYNRRAVALKKTAQIVVQHYNASLPRDPAILLTFPGIGKATASSISAFAFNMPTVFIETNIRRVFIHFFFQDMQQVSDEEILPLVEKYLDRKNPRRWYSAIMDYGVMLKREIENPNRKSAHYRKQPRFEGSRRQVRGKLVRILLKESALSVDRLASETGSTVALVTECLVNLSNEGFVKESKGRYSLRKR